MTELVLPSKVTDKNFIRMPEKGDVVESDEEWNKCGKWMIHEPCGDLEFVDLAWITLQQLLSDGTLLLLKASTAKLATEGATIHCFTRPGKKEAKRAVEAIRRVLGDVDFKGILSYKLNEQTSKLVDNRFGHRRVSVYMQTYRGVFYTRKNGLWIQDIEDGDENVVRVGNQFLKENFSGSKGLISNNEEHVYRYLPDNSVPPSLANWYLFCSCEDDGTHIAEADRVWLVAKQLLEEGLFAGIFFGKLKGAKCAEVRLYVSEHCDVYSRLSACDRIFEEACCRTVMYFTQTGSKKHIRRTGTNNIPLHDFEYMSSGELYSVTKYGRQHLFL